MLDSETVTKAWSYGCPYHAQPDDGMLGQLRLANELWNALVEIYRAHEDARAQIWASDLDVAAATETRDQAIAAASEVRERIKAARKQDRTTVPRDSDAEALAVAREAVSAARKALDAARKAAAPGLKPAFAASLTARHAAVKATYAVFVQERGLGWATYNDITRRRFPAAVAKVEERRKSGLPADLRFRRFDGTGTLTVQVQKASSPRTISALNSGAHPRSGVLRLEPWADPDGGRPKGAARHGTMTVTAGRTRRLGPLTWSIPVVLDRYMPADADVAEVKISRRRCGSHYRLSVSVIAKMPGPGQPCDGGTVAVRLGWAAAGDGWLRVASAGSTVVLPPLPVSLDGIVRVAADGFSAEVLCPPQWRRLLERDDAIRSVRDQNLDVVKDKVTAALKAEPAVPGAPAAGNPVAWEAWSDAERQWKREHPAAARGKGWRLRMLDEISGRFGGAARPVPPGRLRPAPPLAGSAGPSAGPLLAGQVGVTAGEVSRWRAPRRFVMLARDWPPGHDLAGVLEEWRQRDRHLWDYESNERAQVLARRQDAWRCVAAWLCSSARQVTIDGLDVAALRRAPGVDREDPEQARAARANAQEAAPGELRAAVTAAAKARGIPVVTVTRKKDGK